MANSDYDKVTEALKKSKRVRNVTDATSHTVLILSPRQAQIVKSDLGAADIPDQPR